MTAVRFKSPRTAANRGERAAEQPEGREGTPVAAGEPVVSVRELRKTYAGGVEALKGISFDVHEGELFGLLGPNGAGKSTTIGILTTTVRPSGGEACLGGEDVRANSLRARRRMGVVYQESVLDNEFSGRANLRLHARLWGMTRAEGERRIAEVADAIGLEGILDRGVRTYSGGQRRRLEIARALLSEPDVLFLDEPTVGLDPASRHGLWDLIQETRRRYAVSIVLTTHYLDEAERLCDRVASVHEGRIVALDAPERLIASLGEEVLELRVRADAEEAVGAVAALPLAVGEPFVIGNTVTVPLKRGGGNGAQVMEAVRDAGIAVEGISVRRTTLDDVFLRVTGRRIENGKAA